MNQKEVQSPPLATGPEPEPLCSAVDRSLKWSEGEPIPYPVYGHATVSHNHIIYVIGGKDDNK